MILEIYLFDTILGFEFTALCIDAILQKNTFLVALLQAVVYYSLHWGDVMIQKAFFHN
jgi:hypothetical protein